MTWYKFWKAGERYFDRLYTVSTPCMILTVCGYVDVSWGLIFIIGGVAFVGDVLCGGIANGIEPHDLQPVSLKNNL